MAQRITTRTGDTPENNWREVGPSLANSVEVSLNAKGQAQVALKLFYESPADMEQHVASDMAGIFDQVQAALSRLGIRLAGDK